MKRRRVALGGSAALGKSAGGGAIPKQMCSKSSFGRKPTVRVRPILVTKAVTWAKINSRIEARDDATK